MLRRFSRFVIVGLGMFACLHVIFQTCMKQPFICVFAACALFQPNLNKQTAVDVKHSSLVKHCS